MTSTPATVVSTELIQPVEATLKRYEEGLSKVEKERVGSYEALREAVQLLHAGHSQVRDVYRINDETEPLPILTDIRVPNPLQQRCAERIRPPQSGHRHCGGGAGLLGPRGRRHGLAGNRSRRRVYKEWARGLDDAALGQRAACRSSSWNARWLPRSVSPSLHNSRMSLGRICSP